MFQRRKNLTMLKELIKQMQHPNQHVMQHSCNMLHVTAITHATFCHTFLSTINRGTSHITREVCTLFETKNQNKQSISNRIILCT